MAPSQTRLVFLFPYLINFGRYYHHCSVLKRFLLSVHSVTALSISLGWAIVFHVSAFFASYTLYATLLSFLRTFARSSMIGYWPLCADNHQMYYFSSSSNRSSPVLESSSTLEEWHLPFTIPYRPSLSNLPQFTASLCTMHLPLYCILFLFSVGVISVADDERPCFFLPIRDGCKNAIAIDDSDRWSLLCAPRRLKLLADSRREWSDHRRELRIRIVDRGSCWKCRRAWCAPVYFWSRAAERLCHRGESLSPALIGPVQVYSPGSS